MLVVATVNIIDNISFVFIRSVYILSEDNNIKRLPREWTHICFH